MSYLLAKILICLLIAGFIGAIIGWLLRGGCSRKLRDCEDEWKMKMGSLESEYNSNQVRKESATVNKETQAATLKRHAEHVETATPSYSYEKELQEKLDIAQNSKKSVSDSTKATVAGASALGIAAVTTNTSTYADELQAKLQPDTVNLDNIKQRLMTKGVSLSDEKIKLYTQEGLDFEKTSDIEDNYHIQAIEGIDSKYAERLREMDIRTTDDLVKKLHKNHDGIDQVSKALDLEPAVLSSWISMADVIKLPGVDAQTAKLLQAVGISTSTELGITNAHSLHSEMVAFNKKSPMVTEVPSTVSVSLASKIAKLLG